RTVMDIVKYVKQREQSKLSSKLEEASIDLKDSLVSLYNVVKAKFPSVTFSRPVEMVPLASNDVLSTEIDKYVSKVDIDETIRRVKAMKGKEDIETLAEIIPELSGYQVDDETFGEIHKIAIKFIDDCVQFKHY